MNAMADVDFSFVVPMFRTGPSVETLLEQFVTLQITESWELVLVDDGSDDDTCERACRLAARVPGRVTIAQLGRNCGESAAVLQGLLLARGRWLATMDDDLQTPLGEALRLLRRIRASEGAIDVVYAARAAGERRSWLRRFGSGFHQSILRWLLPSMPRIEVNSFRALSADLVAPLRCCAAHGPLHLDRILLNLTQRVTNEPVQYAAGVQPFSRHRLSRLAAILYEACVLSSQTWCRFWLGLGVAGGVLLAVEPDFCPALRSTALFFLAAGAALTMDAMAMILRYGLAEPRIWLRSLRILQQR